VKSRVGERELRKALQRRFVLMAGEKDNDPDDEVLQKYDNEAKRTQGAHRVERAEGFFKAATAAAAELGVKLAWEYMEIPGTAHDPPAMAKYAAQMVDAKPGTAIK
jgi:hypothetical protein